MRSDIPRDSVCSQSRCRFFLPLLCVLLLVLLLPVLHSHNGLSFSQLPILIHVVFVVAAVTGIIHPWLCTVSGHVPASIALRAAAFAVPILPFVLATLACYLSVMASGHWERPWAVLAVLHGAAAWTYAALPSGVLHMVWMIRTGRTTGPASFQLRPFLRSGIIGLILALSFFVTAFVFLSLFEAARNEIALQLIALFLYQVVAHVLFKRIFGPFALKTLDDGRRLDAYPAMVSIFESIAELFLAFSFPSVTNYGVLVLAVLMETLMFVASARHFFGAWMTIEERIIGVMLPKKAAAIAPLELERRGSSISRMSVTDSVVSAQSDLNDADERTAWAVGGQELVTTRRASGFGVLFIFEAASALTFTASFAGMCFGVNARGFGFGSLPNGTCTLGEFLTPVCVAVGTVLVHIVAFALARRHMQKHWNVDPWRLGWDWVRANYVLVGMIMPTTVAEIIVLIFAPYDVSGVARTLLSG